MRGKPVLEALRIPTNVWSGFGFSNSSPSNILKEQLKKEQVSQVRQRLFKVSVTACSPAELIMCLQYLCSMIQFCQHSVDCRQQQRKLPILNWLLQDADDNGTWNAPSDDITPMSFPPNLNCGSGDSDHKSSPLSSSNYLECLASSTVADVASADSTNFKDLSSLLISIGMEKYISE